MGAGQSVDGDKELARGLARQAFSKEHGRDLTVEEEERMAAAFGRVDPTDDHLGAVTAEAVSYTHLTLPTILLV